MLKFILNAALHEIRMFLGDAQVEDALLVELVAFAELPNVK
jgi:hypothetical protein